MKTLYARNNIFKKRIPNMIFWIIYILVQISFLGTALGRFSLWFFFIFLSSADHGGRQFYSCIPGHISFELSQANDQTRHNMDHKQCEWLVAFFSRGWDSTWVDFESSVFMWRDLDLALLYITFGQTLLEMILGLKCDFFSCLSFVPIHDTQSMLLLHSW